VTNCNSSKCWLRHLLTYKLTPTAAREAANIDIEPPSRRLDLDVLGLERVSLVLLEEHCRHLVSLLSVSFALVLLRISLGPSIFELRSCHPILMIQQQEWGEMGNIIL
jgi:hypothetical protein